MERSIENIWKEGFLKAENLEAPKVIDLYNRKSIHLTQNLRKMFITNLWGIGGLALFCLLGTALLGSLWVGLIMSWIFGIIIYIGWKALKQYDEHTPSSNSYQYLLSIDRWIKGMMQIYIKVYRILYPSILVSFVLAFWFSRFHDKLLNKLLSINPDVTMVYDMPVFLIIALLVMAAIFSLLAKPIYLLDMKIVYGPILKKLEEMISEMETLRA